MTETTDPFDDVLFIVRNELHRARVHHSLSMERLAELSGIPPGTISRVEGGRHRAPSLEVLIRLAYAMGEEPALFMPTRQQIADALISTTDED